MTATVDGKAQSSLLFGHPKGLYVLSLTETWERFSYYGMRALLVLYLTQRFPLISRPSVLQPFYGAYTALVYISCRLLVEDDRRDRFFGYNKSVLLGACLMIVGHFGLAFQDFYYSHGVSGGAASAIDDARGLQVFYVSMAFLITGVGFLKGNISTMVGNLYPRDSQLRDSGFIIFFWGVNIGATLAAFTCGYVGERYGWQYGFGLAGLGMCAGLVTFLLARDLSQDRRPVAQLPGLSRRQLAHAELACSLDRHPARLAAELGADAASGGDRQHRVHQRGRRPLHGRSVSISLRRISNSTERQRMWCAFIVWAIWAMSCWR